MESNEAERLNAVPHSTLTQHLPYPFPTQEHMLALDHEGSQGLHYIPFYYSQLHLSSNSNNMGIQISDHRTSPNTSSNSYCNTSSFSDKAKVHLDDRKKKRMFSNRESARRCRMRKRQQIESLQCQVDHLQTLNHQLSQKIIYLLQCNQQILQQNVQLKEKASSLQVALSELFVPLGHAEQPHHILNSLVAEPSAQSIASSGA